MRTFLIVVTASSLVFATCAPVDEPVPTGSYSANVEVILLRHPEVPSVRVNFHVNINRRSDGNLCAFVEQSPRGILPERTFRCPAPLTWARAVAEGLLVTGEIHYASPVPEGDSRFDLCRRQLAVNRGEPGAFVPFRLRATDVATGMEIPVVPVESGGRCAFELRPPPGL